MPKPRPIQVHVNSTGKKQNKLQELIHSQQGFVFLPLNGKLKTAIYNKGFIDGRKQPIRIEHSYESCSGTVNVLAFSSIDFSHKINGRQITGVVPLDRTFLISANEADRFISSVCEMCDYLGDPDCFRRDFRCSEIDRDKYRDGAWFELKQELRKERKRFAFPVKG
ncbi:hypothetical protein M2277_005648 [Paenibacillus sp. LBL]|uniref:hypothetical protein n=1 Tax=Paenibacillus sp. LBL TaxID=2940563 RepID=UPI002473BDC6|nr:hypothetical protein [Paenibacillus sp. LBL]MDH6674949.1 hypothetical protein [Paenibacillus sp. LBL]